MADFQAIIDKFEAEDVKVIAGSVDTADKTKELVQKAGITYPVAYGLDAEVVAAKTGAFYDHNKKFLHATGFLIRPDNSVEVACYSSGPIGRFVARDVLNLVKFYKSKNKK